MGVQPSDSEVRAALQAYFAVLQSNPTAEEMGEVVVTDDFETGFAGGPDGPRDFLAARAGFVDQRHEVDEVLEREDLPSGEVRIKTRLEFSLRQLPGNELFTGPAFHTWLLRRDEAGRLTVAARLIAAQDRGAADSGRSSSQVRPCPTGRESGAKIRCATVAGCWAEAGSPQLPGKAANYSVEPYLRDFGKKGFGVADLPDATAGSTFFGPFSS